MCVVVIGIVGEETYKIYSKKVFQVEEDIDATSQQIKELEAMEVLAHEE